MARRSGSTARGSLTPRARASPSRSGCRCLTPTRANGRRSPAPRSDSALTEPAAGILVAVDDRPLAAVEHDVEVAPVHGLLGPPAVDDAPLLAHERDRPPVDLPRRAVQIRLDLNRPRRVQSSRATRHG